MLIFGPMWGVASWLSSGQPLKGIVNGLVYGKIFAILLTLLVSWLARRVIVHSQVSRPDFGDEQVIVEGPAHHLRGVEAVGGYI